MVLTHSADTVGSLGLSLRGYDLLDNPLYNKGTAFTQEERDAFGLNGLLPPHVFSIDEQIKRRMDALRALPTDFDRHVFMRELQDTNETLYYALLTRNIEELLPIIYTPSVGLGCQRFSRIYKRPRGLFLSLQHQDRFDEIFANPRFDSVECIVVTDGERILGLGDLGAGGMGIPIGKLAIYSAAGGINPATTLPITLDVGTNNDALLDDPLYIGLHQRRTTGQVYDDFIEAFIQAVMKRWPNVLLQWEDFHKTNASRLLERYRDRLCCFNDDIQGTASVTTGALMAAMQITGEALVDQRVVVLGGGSAGIGIADLIKRAMVEAGLSDSDAARRFYIVGRHGLVTDATENLEPFQKAFVQDRRRVADWQLDQAGQIALLDVVRNVKPTVLVGVSGQAGVFTETIIREMARHVVRPIIFPLSNPTACVEAQPASVIEWTDGRAIVGTGSPFAPFEYQGETHTFAQTNNSYIFPGVGLATLAVKARRVSDGMFLAAARALAALSPARTQAGAALLPPLNEMPRVSRDIAVAVARQARAEGLTDDLSDAQIDALIDAKFWRPEYSTYHYVGEAHR
ncbi:NAD-dependent malic enzyme [uncultured Propionivibrio sp.]|uniref:NAD-dependent malic enzyme n=1 Tax=uncultured Propionivibrio sp. TaxID=426737 RepID=UPI0029C08FAC|nr:NAD-dependent malic enzyme [uncultured Propionivibrio sp.]